MGGTGWNMEKFKTCYQVYFNVTTPCAECIGSVFNMATYNMSTSCYNLCKGRPHRKDGTHWCWEDCQSCMYYVGKKMTECYGEPYDMQCRFAKEINREKWYEKNERMHAEYYADAGYFADGTSIAKCGNALFRAP